MNGGTGLERGTRGAEASGPTGRRAAADAARLKGTRPWSSEAGPQTLTAGSLLPLVIVPRTLAPSVPTDEPNLIAWVERHANHLEALLARHGGILFRGFDLVGRSSLAHVRDSLGYRASEYVRGVATRTAVGQGVYTSSENPAFLPIPLHSEMAYTQRAPDRILFLCDTPPAVGGETPIADNRRVYARIPRTIRARLEGRELLYVQNLPRTPGRFIKKSWPMMFGTEDHGEVERLCALMSVQCRWKPGKKLELRERLPASRVHPETGETVWFNQAHNFHDSFSLELKRDGQHVFGSLVGLAERFNRSCRRWNDLPFNARYGDGGAIADADITEIRDAYWSETILFRWQRGDLLLLDNVLTAHGRLPFKGPRRILATLCSKPEPTRWGPDANGM